jgi:hypothetical protein
MVPFGTASRVVGTPPFIAPEVMAHQALDQRADLFALGALAYWLITRQYAYRARMLSQLRDAWRVAPPPLLTFVPHIPKTLNDLVMALLSLDRNARPTSAAEVVEILNASANLEPDDTPEVRQAYLTTPQLVGRTALVFEISLSVQNMLDKGHGTTLLLEGVAGIGRSRLLAELVLQSKVFGVTILATGADISGQYDYGVVWELIEQLFENAYDLAMQTITPHLDVLRPLFPTLTHRMSPRVTSDNRDDGSRLDLLPSEEHRHHEAIASAYTRDRRFSSAYPPASRETGLSRPRIQQTLLEWFLSIASHVFLVIAVDDIDRADEPSVALLSALASKSQEHRLVLAFSRNSETEITDSSAQELITRNATRIKVDALGLDAIERLILSIFGDTPNARLLASRVYAISKGNARVTMQMAQHLVDQGLARYHSGGWSLPDAIDETTLPKSLTEALVAKLDKLSAYALDLAQTIALSADQYFTIEQCLLLAGHGKPARLTETLNELVAAEVLMNEGPYYGITSRACASVLTETLSETDRKERHLRLVEVPNRRGNKLFYSIDHLIRAGELQRALDRFLSDYRRLRERAIHDPQVYTEHMQSLPQGWIQIVETLIRVCRELNRPHEDVFLLEDALVEHDSFSINGDDSHLLALIARLGRDTGLADYHEIDATLNEPERLSRAIERAQQRYDASAPSERLSPPLESIADLFRTLTMAIRAAANSLDYDFIASLPSMAPLIRLSPAIESFELLLTSTRHVLASHVERAREGYLALLNRLEQPDRADIPETYYEHARLAVIYAIGSIEAGQGLGTTLDWVSALDLNPLFRVNAWRIRLIYYSRQGALTEAERCQKQLELLRIQNSPIQTLEGVECFQLLIAYSVADDLIRVGHMVEQITKMSERFRGWRPIYDFARGEYQRIRGDYADALIQLENALALAECGRHMIWPYAAGACIKTLLDQDRLSDARSFGIDVLNQAISEGFGYVRHHIGIPLAIAEARLGNEEAAKTLSADAITQLTALGVTGILLGYAYEARARVAAYTGDHKGFVEYAHHCQRLYQTDQYPALAAKFQRVVQKAHSTGVGFVVPCDIPTPEVHISEASTSSGTIASDGATSLALIEVRHRNR